MTALNERQARVLAVLRTAQGEWLDGDTIGWLTNLTHVGATVYALVQRGYVEAEVRNGLTYWRAIEVTT